MSPTPPPLLAAALLLLATLVACEGGSKESPVASRAKSDAPADPHAGHDAVAPTTFDLVVTPASELRPGARTQIVFEPRTADGSRVPELAIVHEKPFHLLMVSRDLSYFAHEHPEVRDDGTLALELAFPQAGEYVLFGDFTPKGAGNQVVRKMLSVAGDTPPAKPLTVDDRAAPKSFGDARVTLGPATMVADDDVFLEFTLERGGRPVDDLRPYLGAMGHCVIIGEDTTTFLHSHPQGKPDAAGNVVKFHTKFPKPGLYKIWGQFDSGGSMLIADFVVDVGAGSGAAAGEHGAHPH